MGFFSCLTGSKKLKNARRNMLVNDSGNPSSNRFLPGDSSVNDRAIIPTGARGKNNGAITFSFRELAFATQHFRSSNMIGEGGFGKVFRGRLESGQVVAIKMLNHAGVQGSKEFLVEILMLIMLRHHNLVSLIGFCTDGDEKLLVYEYLAQGSLERHLFGHPVEMGPLDWNTRIKIALGAAKGLEYLHEVANPPVIYRDLKSANILLDNEFNPKLSDFGLAKLAPVGENTHVSTRVMGTYGYCAPDYAMSGKLTMKSDIYSFGVVLLELITGRRAYDSSKDAGEQNLISWARPFLSDRRMFIRLADPLLRGCFHLRPFYQLIVITTMCLQEASEHRPIISDVVVALEHVASQPYIEVDERVGSPSILSSPSPCGNKRVR